MPVSFDTYERVALEDDNEGWELDCGHLRKKPGMTAEHSDVNVNLADQLTAQLDRSKFRVKQNTARLRISNGTYFIPDLVVISDAARRRLRRENPRRLEIYDDPMPLVVEVWSPSTGEYDVDVKLLEYQVRGDLEIWRLHPYEKTLTVWRRNADGSYTKTEWLAATISPVALPGVVIDIPALFEE